MEELKKYLEEKMNDFVTSTMWTDDERYVGMNVCEEILNKIDQIEDFGKILL